MNTLRTELNYIVQHYRGEDLAKKLFFFVKNGIKYRFGDWTIKPSVVLNIGQGMCTTKSRLLFHLLKEQGFEVYYRTLKINARNVFGKFTIPEIARYLSVHSVHFYLVLRIDGKEIELDCSLDENLERRIKKFSYLIIQKNFSDGYTNFIDKHDILSISGLENNIDHYINRKIQLRNRFKFFISNICLDFVRSFEFSNGIIDKNDFLGWLKKRNLLHYILFMILINIRK